MPAKTKAAVTDGPAESDSAKRVRESSERNAKEAAAGAAANRGDRERATAERTAREASLIEQRKAVKPDPEGDIDQRMAALEQDHKRMGVR